MASTLTKQVLLGYPNKIFVETGTLWGDGVQLALDCGFHTVYSIELNRDCVAACEKRFEDLINQGRVGILHGDSVEIFPELLKELTEPATFWLDAHWDGGPEGLYKCPLPQELTALLEHPIKTHSLLIDDRRLFGQPNTTWGQYVDEQQILELVYKINPLYNINYEDGFVPKDIIAATV